VSVTLDLEPIACPLCRAPDATLLCAEPHLAQGLCVIEVPNVGGWGGALFGRHWSGLDFSRHLIHFTPATMRTLVEQCGGRVVNEWHWSARRGEVVRYFIRHADEVTCAS
jgi:hypothetical protein